MTPSDIWYLGDRYVTKKRTDGRAVVGRAEFCISVVRKQKELRLNPDGIPHPRHMNIENFPIDSSLKMMTLEFAKQSETFPVPDT